MSGRPTPPMIGVHLDLKYQMPSTRYLLQWVRQLSRRGVNTLLLEYEDKFPYERYPFLRDPEAFTPSDLRGFLAVARDAGLRIIPLVPTLSHLEFALAHPELAALREAPRIPTQICPSNRKAVGFVGELVDEVLAYHTQDEWIHLGGDETWFMGTCPACRTRVINGNITPLWVAHMKPMIRRLQKAGKRVMLFDDAFWGKPEAALTAGLPKGTVLTPWNYGARAFPSGEAMEQRVNLYRRAGLGVAGASCLNWGVLIPQHDHCLANQTAWTDLARRTDMLGVIHTAWACFHVPLPMQALHEAAAGAAGAQRGDPKQEVWQQSFLAREFGCDARALPAALRQVGQTWEQGITGLDRPIAPIVYGYMDMVVHYPGGQDERRRRGLYPLDWSEIDFNALLARKLALLKALPDQKALRKKFDEMQAAYAAAHPVLSRLANRARRNRRTATLLACLAALKLESARAVRLLLFGGSRASAATQSRRLQALHVRLRRALTPFYEPASCDRLLRLWVTPVLTALHHHVQNSKP